MLQAIEAAVDRISNWFNRRSMNQLIVMQAFCFAMVIGSIVYGCQD